MTLHIPSPVLDRIVRDCLDRRPNEACGLLGAAVGKPDWLQCIAPAPNHSSTPDKAFFIEPHKQWQIESAFERSGVRCIGSYHSHPTKDAQPSGMDCEFMGDRIMLIVGLTRVPDIRAWRDNKGKVEEVTIENLPIDLLHEAVA